MGSYEVTSLTLTIQVLILAKVVECPYN